MSDKQHFIDTYVAAFLGSRAAAGYIKWCMMDQHSKLTTDQPIDDAVYQAEQTWDLLLEFRPAETPGTGATRADDGGTSPAAT